MTDTVGLFFKTMRLARGDSLDLVSSATELKYDYLQQIESDAKLPDPDALAVLVSYYGVDRDIAEAMMDMITTEEQEEDMPDNENTQDGSKQPKKIQINMDANMRVLYTDLVQVSESDMGVVLNFVQKSPDGHGVVVSRIGMSHAQATALKDLLNKHL